MEVDQDQEELEETTFYICAHLGETEKRVINTIRRIIQELGPDQTLTYLKQAREVEKAGGMLTHKGKRRTPGGVFFQLVKDQAGERVQHIFQRDWKAAKAKLNREKTAMRIT